MALVPAFGGGKVRWMALSAHPEVLVVAVPGHDVGRGVAGVPLA